VGNYWTFCKQIADPCKDITLIMSQKLNIKLK